MYWTNYCVVGRFRARDDSENSVFQDGENQDCCLLGCDTVYYGI